MMILRLTLHIVDIQSLAKSREFDRQNIELCSVCALMCVSMTGVVRIAVCMTQMLRYVHDKHWQAHLLKNDILS